MQPPGRCSLLTHYGLRPEREGLHLVLQLRHVPTGRRLMVFVFFLPFGLFPFWVERYLDTFLFKRKVILISYRRGADFSVIMPGYHFSNLSRTIHVLPANWRKSNTFLWTSQQRSVFLSPSSVPISFTDIRMGCMSSGGAAFSVPAGLRRADSLYMFKITVTSLVLYSHTHSLPVLRYRVCC